MRSCRSRFFIIQTGCGREDGAEKPADSTELRTGKEFSKNLEERRNGKPKRRAVRGRSAERKKRRKYSRDYQSEKTSMEAWSRSSIGNRRDGADSEGGQGIREREKVKRKKKTYKEKNLRI